MERRNNMNVSVVKTETKTGIITPGDVLYLFPDKTVSLNDEYAKDILKDDIASGLWHKHGYALDPEDKMRFTVYEHPRCDDNAFLEYIFRSNPEWDATGKDRKCSIDLTHSDYQTDEKTCVGLYEFIIKNGCTSFKFYYRLNRVVIKPSISDDKSFVEFDGANRIRIRA